MSLPGSATAPGTVKGPFSTKTSAGWSSPMPVSEPTSSHSTDSASRRATSGGRPSKRS